MKEANNGRRVVIVLKTYSLRVSRSNRKGKNEETEERIREEKKKLGFETEASGEAKCEENI